jgi:hypothetical protein
VRGRGLRVRLQRAVPSVEGWSDAIVVGRETQKGALEDMSNIRAAFLGVLVGAVAGAIGMLALHPTITGWAPVAYPEAGPTDWNVVAEYEGAVSRTSLFKWFTSHLPEEDVDYLESQAECGSSWCTVIRGVLWGQVVEARIVEGDAERTVTLSPVEDVSVDEFLGPLKTVGRTIAYVMGVLSIGAAVAGGLAVVGVIRIDRSVTKDHPVNAKRGLGLFLLCSGIALVSASNALPVSRESDGLLLYVYGGLMLAGFIVAGSVPKKTPEEEAES